MGSSSFCSFSIFWNSLIPMIVLSHSSSVALRCIFSSSILYWSSFYFLYFSRSWFYLDSFSFNYLSISSLRFNSSCYALNLMSSSLAFLCLSFSIRIASSLSFCAWILSCSRIASSSFSFWALSASAWARVQVCSFRSYFSWSISLILCDKLSKSFCFSITSFCFWNFSSCSCSYRFISCF